MNITRRTFIKNTVGALALPSLYPLSSLAESDNWKRYEITTEVNIDAPNQIVQAWIPLPFTKDTDYFKTIAISTDGDAKQTSIFKTPTGDTRMLWSQWDASGNARNLVSTFLIATRERNTLNGQFNKSLMLSKDENAYWTRSTEFLPTDGIVKDRANEILEPLPKNASDVDKAKAIYNWVVENTYRDPATKGCGVGDVKLMLESNNLGGKCADINAVFVALARSSGIPARDVYGIRVDDSARGYKSLGRSADISKAQHCRAEFFAKGYGWVAVDPADVRKVILEEPGNLTLTDSKVIAIRDYLFGNWEMNWMPYNYGHDIALLGSKLGSRGKIPFLMYPQGETKEGRLDSLDPVNFKYKITSKLIA
ncbi:transglutaminase domain-containing protein [Polynucleobacter paneuropaeus]|nr:transglutaminase domain-containing protein [Polynucleobacter paneuropaeus]